MRFSDVFGVSLPWRAGLPFALAGVAASACVPSFDDDLPLIDGPRVLAVQAEPAEAGPGEEIELHALAVAPSGDATSSLSWGLCLARKPLTELGPVNPVCIRAPDAADDSIMTLGSGTSVKATLPMKACQLFGPSLPEAMNGEPPGRPVDPDPSGGFYQPVGVTLRETGVTTLGAVRIFCLPSGLDQEQSAAFNANYRRNLNPVIDSLRVVDAAGKERTLLDGEAAEAVRVAPGQRVSLVATWATCEDEATTCAGAESYVVFNADTRVLDRHRESVRISWFANAGRFANPVTGRDENEFPKHDTQNDWTAPTETGEVALWAVIRDTRGGQSFRSFSIRVAP